MGAYRRTRKSSLLSLPSRPSFPQNPSSLLLRSDDAFEVYLDALASSGREPSIDPAVRKRQSLLDSLPPSSPPSSDTSTSNTNNSIPSDPSPSSPQSRSEKIAAELLARRANSTSDTAHDPPPPNPAIANLAAALSKGAGVSGNPIYVTLSERKHLNIVLRPGIHTLS